VARDARIRDGHVPFFDEDVAVADAAGLHLDQHHPRARRRGQGLSTSSKGPPGRDTCTARIVDMAAKHARAGRSDRSIAARCDDSGISAGNAVTNPGRGSPCLPPCRRCEPCRCPVPVVPSSWLRGLSRAGRGDGAGQVEACGICHSDVLVKEGHVPIPYPRVPGHEVAGVVHALGAGVNNWTVGQRVASAGMGATAHLPPLPARGAVRLRDGSSHRADLRRRLRGVHGGARVGAGVESRPS